MIIKLIVMIQCRRSRVSVSTTHLVVLNILKPSKIIGQDSFEVILSLMGIGFFNIIEHTSI